MVSRSKLYSQLDALESELEEKTFSHLEIAANGNNDLIFCVEQFNTFKELKGQTDQTTEYLIKLGAQILVLKNKLGEPTEGSIAERICWYCREWSSQKNAPRKGHQEQTQNLAQTLARQFLQEIKIQMKG